jgi:hypothetical protein
VLKISAEARRRPTAKEASALEHRHDVRLEVGDEGGLTLEVKVVDEPVQSYGRARDASVVSKQHGAPVARQSELKG